MPIAIFFVIPELISLSEPELVQRAATLRAQALTLRDQPNKAWPKFQQSLHTYEELHRRGVRTPTLYLHLGNLSSITEQIGKAVYYYRRGLELDPTHQQLRDHLNRARQKVLYQQRTGFGRPPIDSRPPWLPRIRVSNWTLVLLWAGYLVCWLCVTRGWMKRQRSRKIAGGVGFVGVVLMAAMVLLLDHYDRPGTEYPFVVIHREGPVNKPLLLRLGNGERYPSTSQTPLRAGMEGKLLAKRGEWIQLELASRQIGWVPRKTVLIAE